MLRFSFTSRQVLPNTDDRRAGLPKSFPRRKGGVGVVVALGVTAAILVAAGVVFLILWNKSSSGLSNDKLQFLPDDPKFVAFFDVQGVMKSPIYKRIVQVAPAKFTREKNDLEKSIKEGTGYELSDIKNVLVGGQFNEDSFSLVIVTTKPVQATEIAKVFKGKAQEETINGRVMYSGEGNRPGKEPGFCVIDPTTVVASPSKAVLRAILQRGKAPNLSDGLKAALSQADFSAQFALALGEPPPGSLDQMPRDPMAAPLKNAKQAALEIRVGDDMRVKATLLFAEPGPAVALQTDIKKKLEEAGKAPLLPPQFKNVLDSVKVSVSGNNLEGSGKIDGDTLIMVIQMAQMAQMGR